MIITKRGKARPPLILGIIRVASLNILRVNENVQASNNVENLLSVCSRSFFALRVLRAKGLPDAALHTVTNAITIARLMYAVPAWWGLTSE